MQVNDSTNGTLIRLGADLLSCCNDIIMAQTEQMDLHIDGPHPQLDAHVSKHKKRSARGCCAQQRRRRSRHALTGA